MLAAERLLGQTTPPGLHVDAAARLAMRRVLVQQRYRGLMTLGAVYGFHRAILAELGSDGGQRRRIGAQMRRPGAGLRYLQSLRMHISQGG